MTEKQRVLRSDLRRHQARHRCLHPELGGELLTLSSSTGYRCLHPELGGELLTLSSSTGYVPYQPGRELHVAVDQWMSVL